MHAANLPVTPGAIIGYRANGTPVRLIGGGSEPVPPAPANGGTDPAQPPAPAPASGQGSEPPPGPAAPQPAAAPDPGGHSPQGGQQPGTVDDLPQWAQKTIRDLRSESAASRTRAKERDDALEAFKAQNQQQMDGIARALGLKPEETTPEQLMAARDAANAERDAERARARSAQVELAAYRAAAMSGADPARLLDSRAFVSTLDGLDPSSDAFAQIVADRVAAAVEANPSWRLGAPQPVPAAAAPGAAPAVPVPPPLPAPTVPASGPLGSFTPPPSGNRQLTAEDAKSMTPAQVIEAINKGSFAAEGFGPSRKLQR